MFLLINTFLDPNHHNNKMFVNVDVLHSCVIYYWACVGYAVLHCTGGHLISRKGQEKCHELI